MSQLSTIIEQAFEDRANFSAADCPAEIRQAKAIVQDRADIIAYLQTQQ